MSKPRRTFYRRTFRNDGRAKEAYERHVFKHLPPEHRIAWDDLPVALRARWLKHTGAPQLAARLLRTGRLA